MAIRTPGLQLRRLSLYPAELQAHRGLLPQHITMPFVLDIVNMKVGRSGRLFCCRVVLNVSLIAGGASAAAFEVCRRFRRSRAHCLAERGSRASRAEMTTRRRMVMRHGVRARRFPRKTQAGASVGKAAQASSGGRGRKGSRSGAFMRQSRPEAQASRPWIHAAVGPCGTRAVLAATNVAAHAGGKEHVTHRAINTVLQQNVYVFKLDRTKNTGQEF